MNNANATKSQKFLLILIGLLFTFQLNAQNDFKIGINAGINYPKLRGNEYAKYHNFKVGYLVGISFDYHLKNSLSIKANINYEKKIEEHQITYFTNNGNEIGKENFEHIYEYINLPILLKFEFGKSIFFVNSGPFFNYLLSVKAELDDLHGYDIESSTKKIDFGVSLGIGANISLNERNDLTIEIRDDFGLINTSDVPVYNNGTVKTNSIKLIVGWNFGLGNNKEPTTTE